MSPHRSLSHVVAAADNFPAHDGLYPAFHPETNERYVPFHLTYSDFSSGLTPVGLLRPEVVEQLVQDREASPEGEVFQIQFSGRSEARAGFNGGDEDEDMVSDLKAECVWFAQPVVDGGKDAMSSVMRATAERWREAGRFPGPLAGEHTSSRKVTVWADGSGWRDERYMIYCDPRSSALRNYDASKPYSNAAFELERAACAIFGLATFGVHMTGEPAVCRGNSQPSADGYSV